MKKLFIVILMLFVLVGCTKKDQTYDENLFDDGLLAVSVDGSSWGYINPKGERVIDDKFDGAGAFYKGYAIVIVDQFYQVIDKNGDFVFDHGYDYLRRSPETGLLIFEQDDLFGIMDDHENVIVEPIYDLITDYTDGYALVKTTDQTYYFLDEKGNIMNDEAFTYATQFQNGFATVKNSEDKAGLINDHFELVIDYEYDDISVVDVYGYVVTRDDNDTVSQDDDSYNLIKVDDLSVVLENFDYIEFRLPYDMRPTTPLYRVVNDDTRELYLYDGTKFTDHNYTFLVTIGGYLITYQDVNKIPTEPFEELREYAIYDEDGTLIKKASIVDSKHIYQGYYRYDLTLYLAVTDGDFIDIYGQNETYRIEADEAKSLSDQLIFAVKDGFYGAYDLEENLVLDFEYDYLFQYQDGYIAYSKEGLYGVINHRYETLIEPMYQYIHTEYHPRVVLQ